MEKIRGYFPAILSVDFVEKCVDFVEKCVDFVEKCVDFVEKPLWNWLSLSELEAVWKSLKVL